MLRIIGIGSPHGDDRFGWAVVEALHQQGLPAGVQLQSLDRPGPALLSHLQAGGPTILVDAADAGLPAGQLRWVDRRELARAPLDGETSHCLGIQESLQLADALNIELPPIKLLICQLAQSDPLAGLSPQVEAAVGRACDELCRLVVFS